MSKIDEQFKKKDQQIYSCVLSGILLGLSTPSFSIAPTGFFAWIWLAPLLFELKRTENFLPFLGRVLIAVGIGFSMITLWVANASIYGFPASTVTGTFVWTIPLIWFYAVRRFLNWSVALFSLPFFWTAWEWLYHLTPLSFGAVRLGYTQADLLWLIQYADLTGIDGVTFWLVSVNIALFLFFKKFAELKEITPDLNRRKLFRAAPETFFVSVLFALPLSYAAYIFFKPQSAEKEISIIAVQSNISPFSDYSPENLPNIFGRQLALTAKAVQSGPADLIVWNEAAVPFVLSENIEANKYFAKQIKKWDAPVLTGLIEVKNYSENESRPPLLAAQNRDKEFFNAAALFQPSAIENGRLPVDLSEMYLKRRLMPFLEYVPFSDRFPFLADLIIPIGTRPRLSYGEKAKTFDLRLRDETKIKIGAMICYENLYPEMSADAVRDGAQVLASITNEGFFGGSQGQYQLAAFSRFRSIETRRAMIRAAATGMTGATDKFGRVTAEVPMWSEQILRTKVSLSDEQTFYVRFGDWLPKLCLLAVGLLFLLIFSRIIRRNCNASFFSKSTAAEKHRFNNFSVAALYKTTNRREK